MKRIKNCTNKQLTEICQKVIHLEELNEKLRACLPSNIAEHCLVSSFSNSCLLLTLTDAKWATELRYALPDLRDALRRNGLYQLSSIKMVVQTPEYTSSNAPLSAKSFKGHQLSNSAIESLKEAGESCHYEPLKQALLKMALKDD